MCDKNKIRTKMTLSLGFFAECVARQPSNFVENLNNET